MRTGQEAAMILCGLMALMIMFIFGAAPASMIVFTFDLPETYLGPIALGFMALFIGLIFNGMRKEKLGWKRDDEKRLAESKNRQIVELASDFKDSRKAIAKQVEWDKKRASYRSELPEKSEKSYRRRYSTVKD